MLVHGVHSFSRGSVATNVQNKSSNALDKIFIGATTENAPPLPRTDDFGPGNLQSVAKNVDCTGT